MQITHIVHPVSFFYILLHRISSPIRFAEMVKLVAVLVVLSCLLIVEDIDAYIQSWAVSSLESVFRLNLTFPYWPYMCVCVCVYVIYIKYPPFAFYFLIPLPSYYDNSDAVRANLYIRVNVDVTFNLALRRYGIMLASRIRAPHCLLRFSLLLRLLLAVPVPPDALYGYLRALSCAGTTERDRCLGERRQEVRAWIRKHAYFIPPLLYVRISDGWMLKCVHTLTSMRFRRGNVMVDRCVL